MMDSIPPNQKRIALWHVPRCLSTAMVRSMATLPNIHVFFEFFAAAAAMSEPQTTSTSPPGAPDKDQVMSQLTHKGVKEHIESRSSEKDLVFITDPAYAMDGKYHMLPEGFQHTFIIRHPVKVFSSWETILKSSKCDDGDLKSRMPKASCFKELYDLHQYVTTELHQPSIIVDADDLVADPVETVKAYCQELDLLFDEESMFQWDAIEEGHVPSNWEIPDGFYEKTNILGWYKNNLFDSTGLHKGTPQVVKWDDLSNVVSRSAVQNMPYYNKLYKLRVKPDIISI